MTLLFHSGCQWRGASEFYRWAWHMKLVITSFACVVMVAGCRHAELTRHQPPTASEIRQKIVGTWVLDSWSENGTPEHITVVFGADGSFESSRNFTDFFPPPPATSSNRAYRATWQATDGYFTVTISNYLPSSNLQMFRR
jgi:hypothetical protein